MSKILLLIGDSNVSRWYTRIGEPYLPLVEYVPAHNSEELSTALKQVKPSYQMVVFASLTNIIVAGGSDCQSNSRIDRFVCIEASLKATLAAISHVMESVPDPSYYLAMPTVRTRPDWYYRMCPEIAPRILAILKTFRPSPQPLPAFLMSGQDLDSDGIHLSAMAGIPYVQHLVDRPRALLEISATEGPSDGFNYLSTSLVTLSATVTSHDLQIKVLTDQLLLTRCQHAEEVCGRENVDNLNRFIVIGAPYLPLSDQLQPKLRSQVAFYIKSIDSRLPTDIVHVRQFRGRHGGIYDVEMSSVASSNRIRSAYGAFFRRGSRGPPQPLSKVSITNSLTYASRVRVRLMKEVAKRHKAANPDLQVFVTNYLPRPCLKLKEKKGPMSTYTFCEAMQRFSHHLTPEFLVTTAKFANVMIPREDLTNFFLVLSSDLLQNNSIVPTSPSEGQLPPTSRTRGNPGLQGTSPAPGTSSGVISASGKKRRVSPLTGSNTRPLLPKRGRSVKLVQPQTKGRKGRKPRVLDAMDIPSDDEEDEVVNQVEETISITPIDFSQEVTED